MKRHDETDSQSTSASGFSKEKLRGVLAPFPTPFDKDDEVDERALRSNIVKWNETGVSGYVALGSTGERVHLDERECLRVIETARSCVPSHLALIAGAGQQGVRATINEARRFVDAGADALLVITPHFYRKAMTQTALIDYYNAVADASTVPVLLYSMPELTSVALAPETVARLSEHENITGIKDSSGDIINLAETLRLVPDEFAVLTGNGATLYAALCAGSRGAILAVACVAAEQCVAIRRAVEAGDHGRALDLQRKLTPLARSVTSRHGIGGLKAALDMLGYVGGPVRAPLRAANEEARREIARLLEGAAFSSVEKSGGVYGLRAGALRL